MIKTSTVLHVYYIKNLLQRHRLLQIAKNLVHLFDVLVRKFLELQKIISIGTSENFFDI